MPRIEYKFDLGHIITIIVVLAGVLVGYGKTSAQIDAMRDQIYDLKSQIAHLNTMPERMVRVETILQDNSDAIMRSGDRAHGR